MKEALDDIIISIKSWHLWSTLGWLELRQRYKRSLLGPFWLTLSMGILVLALGVVYGELFKLDVKQYLPMLAIGLVFWNFINGVVTEGCTTYISSASFISQLPTKKFVFILQTLWRNLMMLCHNVVIVVLVLLIFNSLNFSGIPLFLFGFFLVVLNLIWIATFLAIVAVRYRDFPQIVMSFMQVIFYVTPILFSGKMLEKFELLLRLNPFTWFIEIIRSPLIGMPVKFYYYYSSIGLAIIGSLITFFLFCKCKNKIAYWI